MSATNPSFTNTYTLNLEASGKLVVDYSRNPSRFPLAKYIGIRQVKQDLGLYEHISPLAGMTVTDRSKFSWAPGSDRPKNLINVKFDFRPYTAQRFAYPFQLDSRAVEQAAWNIMANYAGKAAQLAMTCRTIAAVDVLTNTANWDGQYATPTGLGFAKWDQGTPDDPAILQCFNYAKNVITLATGAVVNPDDLMLVANPRTLNKMNESPELQSMLKGSYDALPRLKGSEWDNIYGPKILYSTPIVAENTVVNDAKIDGTDNKQFVLPDGVAIFVARPNILVDTDGTFNTIEGFFVEELTVETRYDEDNRRYDGSVVDYYDFRVTAPSAGFLFTDVI